MILLESVMIRHVTEWIEHLGIPAYAAPIVRNLALIVIAVGLSMLMNFIAKKIILRIVFVIARKTTTFWDDILIKHKVFQRMSHLVPAIVIYILATPILKSYPDWLSIVRNGAQLYMLLVVIIVINSFLNALNDIYQQYEISKTKSIKGYIQIIKIVIISIAVILAIAILINKNPLLLFTGLGAFAAVLMLIFKDPILGFVGGIQLSANDMLRPGDWISMPNYGADGTVTDIGLTTVKVQNWDKTITTIPTYALVSNSFQNWRGMEESGGRRIKRAIRIDMESVKFCPPEMLEELKQIQLIRKYIEEKQEELEKYNQEHGIDESVEVNGRRQTNLGIFRKYLELYLKKNPLLHQEMTLIVRHLDPTETGLPMEIYAFSKILAWAEYESIQADIFDHVLAAIPRFGLRVFQNPSGNDLRVMAESHQVH
ncbi:MAG TPA: mechanosensitive ion channel [Bacteroidales bacterium]|nr:mechanosensitive ion channel [Bacteroidales bacterium]